MTKQWFRAKRYGWGWTPATIEGWLVLAAFVVAVVIDSVVFADRLRAGVDMRSAMIAFYLWLAILIVALVVICWMTGERAHWRWGDKGGAKRLG